MIIDHAARAPIRDHWYGDGDAVRMPAIPGRQERFYNVVSLDPSRLPIRIAASVPRIYLPHRFDSDYGIEDLFFAVRPGEVEYLAPIAPGIPVYRDRMDHRARDVSFEKLEPVADPASPRFDRGAVSHPHHQLGGTPLFIQDSPHRLSCLRCQRPMTFLLQFHSDHDLVDFEDGGCAYYWWCSSCSVVGCRTDSL